MLGNLSSSGKFKQAQVSDKDPRQVLNRKRNVTFERTLCEKLYTDVFWRVFIAYSLARVASVSVCFRSKERQREKWGE